MVLLAKTGVTNFDCSNVGSGANGQVATTIVTVNRLEKKYANGLLQEVFTGMV